MKTTKRTQPLEAVAKSLKKHFLYDFVLEDNYDGSLSIRAIDNDKFIAIIQEKGRWNIATKRFIGGDKFSVLLSGVVTLPGEYSERRYSFLSKDMSLNQLKKIPAIIKAEKKRLKESLKKRKK